MLKWLVLVGKDSLHSQKRKVSNITILQENDGSF